MANMADTELNLMPHLCKPFKFPGGPGPAPGPPARAAEWGWAVNLNLNTPPRAASRVPGADSD